jgi:HSP20 family protein
MCGTLTGLRGNFFDDLNLLQQQLDDAFGRWPRPAELRSPGGGWPPVNVGVTPEHADVYLFAPGLDPSELDISLQQNLLSVAGQRRNAVGEEMRCHRGERFTGEFRRSLTLPDDVDPDQVEATYRDGVLHISVGRRQASKPRRISVG